MKNLIGIFAIIIAVIIFHSCDPIENRKEMTGVTTMGKIDQYVSVTQEMRNGVRSNYLLLNSDGLDALSSWDYGCGTYKGTNGRVQLILPGENTIVFTAWNGDGSILTKEFTVTVDECFDVPYEWQLLCGTGEKVWTWDESQGRIWGNGGYLANVEPTWWGRTLDDIHEEAAGEGNGATITFSARGPSLIKNKTDGTTETGTFNFDMSKVKLDAGNTYNWAIGKLYTTGVTVLCGKKMNVASGPINDYDIIQLTEDVLVLAWSEGGDNAGAWGGCWFWMFRAK